MKIQKSAISTACFLVSAMLATSACQAQPQEQKAPAPPTQISTVEVLIPTTNGKPIPATYTAVNNPKALILLFHQAGSNRSEYTDITPRLNKEGYATLAVDQGKGGATGGFLAEKTDLEAAIAWAKANDGAVPLIIWGSSYSASLVYLIASERPQEIAAALAFSGGDYLGGGRVPGAARTITIPIFATSSPGETDEMRPILELAQSRVKFFHVQAAGRHGSSTLSPRKNAKGADANMVAVLAFLDTALKH